MQSMKKKTKRQLMIPLLQGVKDQGLPPKEITRLQEFLTEPMHQMALTNFFKEIEDNGSINHDKLQEYIKYALGNENYDLPTVISQMCNMKEETLGLLKTIQGYPNINKLNGQTIVIGFPGNSNSIEGEIKEASQNKTAIEFTLLDSHNVANKVTLLFNQEYIKAAEVVTEKETSFEKWLAGVQNKKHKNTISQQKKFIRINQKSSKTLIRFLPDGFYSIEIKYQAGRLEKIVFVSTQLTRKQFKAYPDSNDPNEITLVCEELQKPIPYSRFKKNLNIVNFEKFKVNYKTVDESEKCLKLLKGKQGQQNQKELNAIKVMEEINILKTETIGMLKESHMQRILVQFIDMLITSKNFGQERQINEIFADQDFSEVNHILNQIQSKYSTLNKNVNVKQILRDILVETNYSLLVQKKEAVNTVRILSLLTDSDKSLELIQGKEIICFYGATGAGKSTTVNYFMGVPLKQYQDKYGQTIIEKDQKRYKNQRGDQPKIGHSIGTSETIYAQGHEFIQSSIQQHLRRLTKNVVLCDNPGFSDTRGTQYEICTSMSIDMAVEKSNRLRAIVLVIPYNSFTTNRSNLVFDLLDLMDERFPDLLKVGSQTYRTFHILITKSKDPQQAKSFQSRLTDHLAEQLKMMRENSDSQVEYPADTKTKLNVLKVLLRMFKEGKIQFMHPTNKMQKQQFLTAYLSSGSVPKQRYRKFMETGNLKQHLLKHLQTSAHTWATLLIYPFTNLIPERIEECQNRIEELKNDSSERAKNIEDLIQQNLKSPSTIKAYEQQLSNLRNKVQGASGEFNSQTSLMGDHSEFIEKVQQITTDLKDKIKENEEKLSKKQNQISEKQKVLAQLKLKHTEQIQSISDLIEKINKLKVGKHRQIIYQNVPKLGQILRMNARRSDEYYEQAMKNFSEIETLFEREFVVGSQEIIPFYQPIISKQYSILPNKNFDPSSYIEAYRENGSFSQANFEVNVDSQHVQLSKINKSQDGKRMALRVNFEYKVCNRQEDLPYLKLSHYIPNEIKNEVEIKNKQSEILVGIQETERLNNQITETREVITNYNEQSVIFESIISESKRTLSESQEDARSKIEVFFKNAIEREKQSIKNNTEKIAAFKNMNQKSEESLKNQEIKYETHKLTYRRIAFLIKDQLSKNIPQSLVRIIEEATKNDGEKDKESDRDSQFRKNQEEVFTTFVSLFKKEIKSLDRLIEDVLRDERFKKIGNHLPQVIMHKHIQKEVVAQIDEIYVKKQPTITRDWSGFDGNDEEFQKCCPVKCLLF